MTNLNILENYPSAALFGSSARKDNDTLSDVDLLIVSEQSKTGLEIKKLKSYGYSPSVYSWNCLENLSKNGSLFLIHLKQEAIILKDENKKLHNLLVKTKPIGNYNKSLSESIKLAEITIGIPDSCTLKLWAADVLAVAFRNYMISYAASNNEFIFSYNYLVDYASRKFKLDSQFVECLTKLRHWKSIYRNNDQQHEPSTPTLSEIMLVQSFFGLTVNKSFDFQCFTDHEFINKALNFDIKRNWYHKLRMYEGAFRVLDKGLINQGVITQVEGIISNPCFYAGNGEVSWEILRNILLSTYRSN